MAIIGISSRYFCDDDLKGSIIGIPEAYRRAVLKCGGTPIMILPPQDVEYYSSIPSKLNKLTNFEKEKIIDQLKLCDGVIIPGGIKRFEYDIFILKYCLDNDIPILGICLGMQIFTMMDENGDMVHFNRKIESNIDHFILDNDEVHKVKIDKKSKLYKILGVQSFTVNSRHRMEVTNPGVFEIVGYSEDGVIEALERKDKKFAIGVQWHPEMLVLKNDKIAIKLFKAFIDAAKEKDDESKIQFN